MFSRVGVAMLMLVALWAVEGKADLMSVSGSVSYEPDGTKTINLPQFNPGIGTLTGVDVHITGLMVADAVVTNTGSRDGDVTYTGSADVTVSVPGYSSTPISFFLQDTAFAPGVPAGGMVSLSISPTDSASPSPIDIAPYIGSGTVDFATNAFGHHMVSISGPGGLGADIDSIVSVTANVTYHYTPLPINNPFITPEPGSLAVWAGCGVALIGFGWFRRRRTA